MLSLLLSSACSAPRCGLQCESCPPCGSTGPEVLECAATERQPIAPDVSAIVGRTPQFPALHPQYCLLTELEAQCLAARNSPAARLLESEASAVASRPHPGREAPAMDLTRGILERLAWHERDRSAAEGLITLLRLVEAEGGQDNAARRLAQADKILSDIDSLQRQGLVAPVSRGDTTAQKLELLHRQAELQLTIRQLNGRLAEVLDVTLAGDSQFWPEASLVVDTSLPEEAESVQLALVQRADLAALRLALHADDRARLAASRLLLPSAHSALGVAPLAGRLVRNHARAIAAEAAVRTTQLSEVLVDREQAVQREVIQALHTITLRLDQIALTRERFELARQHLASVEKQQNLQPANRLAERQARLALLAVEQELLHDVVEWKIAVVELKRAQGALARECLP